jgi:serine/threonine-protein kinase RsbW
VAVLDGDAQRQPDAAQGPEHRRAVELILPPDTGFVRIARLVASGVGVAAGLDVQEVEDLRIAIDEVCSLLIDASSGGTLHLGFRFDDDGIQAEVAGSARLERLDDDERVSFSHLVLEAVVDRVRRTERDGCIVYELTKHTPGRPHE